MEQVVPWKSLLSLIEPFYPLAGRGRHPYPLETMRKRPQSPVLTCADCRDALVRGSDVDDPMQQRV